MVQRVRGMKADPCGDIPPPGRARDLVRLGTSVVLSIAFLLAPSVRGAEAAALGLLPDPPTIAPAVAGDHLGDVVIVETLVGPATVVDGRVRLVSREPDGSEFEIYVVPPIVGPSAREVAAALENHRVRAVGRVHEFGGRLQLVVVGQGEGRIVAVDVADSPVGSATASEVPSAVASPSSLPPPLSAAAAVEAEPRDTNPPGASDDSPPPGGVARGAIASAPTPTPMARIEAPAPKPTPTATERPAAQMPAPPTASPMDERCAQARARWEVARTDAREPVAALDRCLGNGQSACRAESERARSALAELGAAAERMSWLCPDEGR